MRRDLVLALGVLTAGFGLTLWLDPWADERVNDLFVYRSFAETLLDGGVPYRDLFFEYPPLAVPAIAVPALPGGGEAGFRLAFAAWTLVLAGVVVALVGALAAATGGDRRRALLAAALAPVLCGAMIRTHFDLAPVALLLGALLLLVRDRPRAGLALLGVAVMTKGFPIVAAPVALAWLAGRGQRRVAAKAAATFAGVVTLLAGTALIASPGGAADAVRYQLERPVQVESTPALVLVGLDEVGIGEADSVKSHRSDGLEHPAAGALSAALAAVGAALTGLLALLAAHSPSTRALVLASLAAVTAYAVLGKVLSPQFLIWILPLGALALGWRLHALAAAVGAAALLTLAVFPAHYFEVVGREPGALALIAARNLALLAALALAVRSVRREQHLFDRGRPAAVGRLDHDAVEPGVLV